MAIRIRSNPTSLFARRGLDIANKIQQQALQRLSTLKRINSAADDPAGLVAADRLASQLRGLSAAQKNAQSADSLLGTADGALESIANLVLDIQEAITTVQGDSSQTAAQQSVVDDAIDSIDSLANTARFATTFLLNGASQIRASSADTTVARDVRARRVELGNAASRTFALSVTSSATQPSLGDPVTESTGTGSVSISVLGPRGSADITLAAGSGNATVATAINSVRSSTGVYFDTTGAPGIYGELFGSGQTISITKTGGSGSLSINGGATILSSVGDSATATGTDAVVTLDGSATRATGNNITANTATFQGSFRIAEGTAGGSSTTITASKSGLQFALGGGNTANDLLRIGLRPVTASFLGNTSFAVDTANTDPAAETFGGFLSELKTGGGADLFTDTTRASRIAGEAYNQVLNLRSFVGNVQSRILQPAIDVLSSQFTEISAAESNIRDADIAEETANFTRGQILFQAATAALAQANVIPSIALNLLPFPSGRTAASIG